MGWSTYEHKWPTKGKKKLGTRVAIKVKLNKELIEMKAQQCQPSFGFEENSTLADKSRGQRRIGVLEFEKKIRLSKWRGSSGFWRDQKVIQKTLKILWQS